MRLRLGPAILAALGGGKGMWLRGFSYSSDEGILLYWGFNAYSCRLEGDMEPREERWLPMVKLCAVDTRLLGGGTSSLRRHIHITEVCCVCPPHSNIIELRKIRWLIGSPLKQSE